MRKLLYYPDERLRQACAPVWTHEIESMQQDFDDLIEACMYYDGVAIAAPQVGIFKRVIVVNFETPLVLINPIITWRSSETESDREGCLSFPDIVVHVERPTEIKVSFTSRYGQEVREKALAELYARAALHESEHLDGKLLIDKANGRLQKDMIERKMRLFHRRNK
jgi:peptide deformylase